jgi:hypothetical protein
MQPKQQHPQFPDEFTYRQDGQIEELVAPTPRYNSTVHRDRKNMTFRAIYNSDINPPGA